MSLVRAIALILRGFFHSRASLAFENLALRQQLAVLRRRIPGDLINLIRRMARENPTWGAPRIQSELRLPGYEVADSTVSDTCRDGPRLFRE